MKKRLTTKSSDATCAPVWTAPYGQQYYRWVPLRGCPSRRRFSCQNGQRCRKTPRWKLKTSNSSTSNSEYNDKARSRAELLSHADDRHTIEWMRVFTHSQHSSSDYVPRNRKSVGDDDVISRRLPAWKWRPKNATASGATSGWTDDGESRMASERLSERINGTRILHDSTRLASTNERTNERTRLRFLLGQHSRPQFTRTATIVRPMRADAACR